MLVKLDHVSSSRGENKKYLKPPPSLKLFDLLGCPGIRKGLSGSKEIASEFCFKKTTILRRLPKNVLSFSGYLTIKYQKIWELKIGSSELSGFENVPTKRKWLAIERKFAKCLKG